MKYVLNTSSARRLYIFIQYPWGSVLFHLITCFYLFLIHYLLFFFLLNLNLNLFLFFVSYSNSRSCICVKNYVHKMLILVIFNDTSEEMNTVATSRTVQKLSEIK